MAQESYSVHADIIGLKELRDAFDKARPQFMRFLSDAMYDTGKIAEGKAKENSPINDGSLRSSITTSEPRVTRDNAEITVGTNIKYAKYMEQGTRPHYVSARLLMPWARKKLGNANLAYAVAKSIAKKGVKGRFYFKKAKEDSLPFLDTNLKKAMDKIINYLSK
jgi:Bacteriophage HK97-gp10, putative tail-component